MIYDASTFGDPVSISADLCVVGSGAGGAMAAMVAAEAGLDVVVLEAGGFVPPAAMTQREEQMIPELLWASGGRTTSDRGVKIHQGRSVGGSTVHNTNLCKRIPGPLLDRWRHDRGLSHLPPERWDALYAEVEGMLTVERIPAELRSRHNRVLQRACEELGWAGGGLSHNRTGCVGSGFCEVGCAFDGKNNAAKILIPRLVRAKGRIVSRCQAVRVLHDGGRVSGVEAVATDPRTHAPLGRVTVTAPHVCVSASATATAALLLRSDIPAPPGSTGDTLRIHPALVAAGDFDEAIEAWRGIPQSYECTEHIDFSDDERRVWIVPAFAHPVGTATLLPGLGAAHRQLMNRYAHIGVLTAMLHDLTAGTVRPRGDLGLTVDYWPDEGDRAELVRGLVACVEALFAAGARRVFVPTDPVRELTPSDSLASLAGLDLTRGLLDVTAVHPMGSVPMGDDPEVAAVGSDGRHHRVGGLWVADGSLFPTSIGGPPQLSIYAMGLHVGRGIAAA